MKTYIEKAKQDFEADAKDKVGTMEGEAYAACAQRLDAILERAAQEEADGKLNHGQTVLETAHELIHGDRLKHYGHPSVNFERIAQAWTQYLSTKQGGDVTPVDVCVMMILLKSMRMAEGFHEDTTIDIAGYAALTAILAGVDEL